MTHRKDGPDRPDHAVAAYWLGRSRAQARAARQLRSAGPGALQEAALLGLTTAFVALTLIRLF